MTATTRNIIEELKRAATEQGAGEAVRTIAGPTLETWMRALDGKEADPERLDDLATLMTARLSIRDAAPSPPSNPNSTRRPSSTWPPGPTRPTTRRC